MMRLIGLVSKYTMMAWFLLSCLIFWFHLINTTGLESLIRILRSLFLWEMICTLSEQTPRFDLFRLNDDKPTRFGSNFQ